jgi:hypothetical protein
VAVHRSYVSARSEATRQSMVERRELSVAPRCWKGGLLRCARKDGMGFARWIASRHVPRGRKDGVGFAKTRRCLCEAEGRGSLWLGCRAVYRRFSYTRHDSTQG